MIALAAIVTVALTLNQFLFVLLIARERLLNHGQRCIRGANLFHLHLFTLELLVILEKALQYQQTMARKIARFEIFAEFGVVSGRQ